MIKFNVLYENRVTYPCKLSNLFIDVCNQVGLEVGNVDFTNYDYMILGNPFTNNEDCRTVLSNIAQLAGGFAKIGRDNKVYIKTLKNISNLLTVKYVNAMTVKELNLTLVKALSNKKSNADENIDGNNYFDDFTKNEQWGELNSLVLGLSSIEGENITLDDKTSINENGLTEITIQDNYFLTSQTEREKVIVPIWSNLKGIKYLPFKTNYYGYPYLDSGDMIYIQDAKDNGYISYVFNHKFTFNGSFSGTLETPALTKTQTAYKNTFDLKTKFRNAERSIDKINGQIKDIIEETSENSEKLTKHEQDINSITDTVSSVETKIETVESKADNAQSTADTATTKAETAQSTANTAKSTADDINTNLSTNYYTKTETNSQISKKADSITSSVSKTYSTKTETATAKTEAINSANSSTDTKLKNYTVTSKLGTFIEQNYEHVKVAWNQISEFIQMMIINNNASLAILDENKNVMMALDKKGQHFYKEDGATVFGEMGVQTIDDQNYISFSVPADYEKQIQDGMAWGVTTQSDGKFWPILYIKNFNMPPKNSDGCTGELVLDGCDLVLNAISSGIISGSIKIFGDALGNIVFQDTETGQPLLSIWPCNQYIDGHQNGYISILNNISFYANQAGSNSLRIGNLDNYCLFTDDGSINCNYIYCKGDLICTEYLTAYKGINCTDGYVKGIAFINSSRLETKKNIKKYDKSAIKQIMDTDIYEFNYKVEEDKDKKHVGFIIGKDYKYSKEITSLNKEGKEVGADIYSMVSVAYKAIQEQQEQIEQLKEKDRQKDEIIADLIKRIENLEGGTKCQ